MEEVQWRNLCYSVTEKKAPKHILKGLNGNAKKGELLAVLGPSGSGKTTLLTCLARRVKEGVTGDILFNGSAPSLNVTRMSGFVTQDSAFFPTLTVREVLRYTALLRLPYEVSRAEKEKRVEEVLQELDMVKCADTKIGNESIRGISGGELRRLTIAVELIKNPSLIFLDEPTTGLDSASALMVVETLRKLAHQGKIVFATIHQPRAAALALFDKVIVLAEGNTVYSGPSGDLIPYFGRNGYECPEFENPGDFVLDLINTQDEVKGELVDEAVTGSNKTRAETLQDLVAKYNESPQAQEESRRPSDPTPIQEVSSKPAPRWYQFAWLLHRSFVYKLREPQAVMTQGFNAVFLPFVIGTIYWQISFEQSAMYDRMAAISFLVLMQSFMAVDVIVLFPTERTVYLRDHQNGMYSTSSFYLARTLAELPLHLVFAVVAATVGYWMMGFQNSGEKFLMFVWIVVTVTMTGTSLMMMAGALAKTMDGANGIAMFFLFFFMLFNGFYVNENTIPAAYKWVSEISFVGMAVKAAVVSEFTGIELTCNQPPCLLGNADPLTVLGFESVSLYDNVLYMWIETLVFRFIAYLGLRFLFTGKPWRELMVW